LRALIDGETIADNNGRWWRLSDFAVIGASPPCKRGNGMSRGRWQNKRLEHPDLIEPTATLLKETGKPYVIENVPGERHKFDSHLMLCGTMFGLESKHGNQLRRHSYFEIYPHILILQPPCNHNKLSAIGVFGGGQHPARRKRVNGSGSIQKNDGFGIAERQRAMGIDWMRGRELNQAIPPAYTEYIGKQLIQALGLQSC
jgi:DNA (cytosine-5)-methyltransferase 1